MQAQPFGKYALLDQLNMGGMAEVFLGKTLSVHDVARFVAIKRILPSVADDPEFVRMFIDEANLSVQLTHSNIAQSFELGRIGRSLYIAMEYVSGVDLRHVWERMQEGHEFPLSALVYIVAKLCEGLDYAHRKTDAEGRALGIVHRDISPQNVMIAFDGQVKVIDFGIAKAKVRASQTRVGILKGKFAYMSPEQVAGLELDSRSDVFSVGILLYELLTRLRLFKSDADFMTLERVRHVELFPPRLVNTKIPRELEQIVLKTLARDREERSQSAEALHDMLMRFAIKSGETCSARELGALLGREFAERLQAERVRLKQYEAVEVPAEATPEARPAELNTGTETFASVPPGLAAELAAGAATKIIDMSSELRGAQGASVASAQTRLFAEFPNEKSDTPNLRKSPLPVRDDTRVMSGPPALMDDATSRVRMPPPAGAATEMRLSFAPKRQAMGRESALVWIATGVAALLLVVALWVRSQLDPSARLQIDAQPPSAELLVNERPLGPIAGNRAFEVQPGDVLVEVRAPGYCSWYRHLRLVARETFSTHVSLAQRNSAPCP